MTRTNRLFLASLFTALALGGTVSAGVDLGEAADGSPDRIAAKTAPTDAGKPGPEPDKDGKKKSETSAMTERFRFFVQKRGPFRSVPVIQDVIAANEPFDIRAKNGATAKGVLRRTADGGLHFKGQVSHTGMSEVLDAPVELGKGGVLVTWKLKPDADGFDGLAVGFTLSHVLEDVRPSSGIASERDQVSVVPGPAVEEQNPFMRFDTGPKAEIELTAGKDTWLLFRSKQVDVGFMWIERIAREGDAFSVTMNRALWLGPTDRKDAFHQVHGVSLGKLPARTYTVKWIIHEAAVKDMPFMEFAKRIRLKDMKPTSSTEVKTSFTARAMKPASNT